MKKFTHKLRTHNGTLATMLVLMVVTPIIALGLLGTRLIADQRALAAHEVERGYVERLKSLDQAVQTVMRGLERELSRAANGLPQTRDPNVLRAALAAFPHGGSSLILDAHGDLLYPPRSGDISLRDLAFLERTRPLWQGGILHRAAQQSALRPRGPAAERGWITFFSNGDQHFIWWYALEGRVVALEVSGVDLMAELVAQLPDTPVPIDDVPSDDDRERTVLSDAAGRIVYQWGKRNITPSDLPRAVLSLSPPLESWSLRHYAGEGALPGTVAASLRAAFIAGLLALTVALSAGALFIWRARTRESRLAAERVSFVNQVSHELKTPLTNIRLYTELLESAHEAADIAPDDPAGRHLAVIARESDRLSRLIKDVLTFARSEAQKLTMNPRSVVPDAVIRATLAAHAPSLALAGVTPTTSLSASAPALLDPDALAQIISNLLSNVEKYARSGAHVDITTRADGDTLTVLVADRGPGIPRAHRAKIFEPFWRASDKLSEGVSGTGIGLDIARRLARLHGGDLRLIDTPPPGALFELTLQAPHPTPSSPASETPP